MNIVEATLESYPDVCALFRALDDFHASIQPGRVRGHIDPARSEEKYEWYISGEDRALFIAIDNDEYIGFVNLWLVEIEEEEMRVGRRYAHLDNIFVAPSFRRMGVAKKLIEKASEWSRQRGVSKIELQVFENNSDARLVYEEAGFSTYMRKLELDL